MAKKALLGSVDLSNVSEDFKWYIIVTKFNYEEKYVNNVKQTIQDTQYESLINDYYIPIKYIKKTVTLHDGTKKDKVSKIKECYSNYVFIHCKMTKLLWNLLRTITGAAVILSQYLFLNCLQHRLLYSCRFSHNFQLKSPCRFVISFL
jgi:hypothetical protein